MKYIKATSNKAFLYLMNIFPFWVDILFLKLRIRKMYRDYSVLDTHLPLMLTRKFYNSLNSLFIAVALPLDIVMILFTV